MAGDDNNEPAKDGKKEKDVSPCCECCCGDDGKKVLPEHLRDGNIFENRSCTDCLMVIIYSLFFIGWIIILGLAVKFGKPSRLILPENFRGQLCGDGKLFNWTNLFVPKPSRLSYGICVARCPAVNDFICNNDLEWKLEDGGTKVFNSYYSHTYDEYQVGKAATVTCQTSCDGPTQAKADRYIGLQLKLRQKKCFPVFYNSGPSIFRCIPGKGNPAKQGHTNLTLMALAGESANTSSALGDKLGFGAFFMLGFSEIRQTWRVIFICAVTCMAIAFLWVFLLRWILAPIVYFVILLILAVFIGLGFMFKYFAEDLEAGALPGESGTESQAKLYRALMWVSFLAAAIYFGIMVNMMQRIRIAIAVMKEASKAFTASPSMAIVPFFNFLMLIGFIALFIASAVYIQTMGEEAEGYLQNQAGSLVNDAQNATLLLQSQANTNLQANAVGNGGEPDSKFNVTEWVTLPKTKTLHLYNFFGILWTGNVFLMFGYMTLAMTITSWYFSATQVQIAHLDSEDEEQKKLGREKETVNFVVAKAAWATFANHLGTVIWGALLIAIIQFIRAIFTYIAENYLQDAGDNWTVKIVVRCIECCLWYIEQVIKIISKNAFIICAIRNSNFCVSAYKAVCLLLTNAARLIILTMLSAATIFLVKCFIVGINVFIAFALIKKQELTENEPVESGLFPMVMIVIMSFVIAALFMNVYEACIDTIFLCFLVDEDEYGAEFMPESLSSIVGMFAGAEQARLDYEKKVRDAMEAGNAEPKKV